jgi:hypothetical protein
MLTGVLALGCNTKHQVDGQFRYADGSPVTHGRIVLETNDGKGIWGLIHPDGKFVLGTDAPDDGVPAGTYSGYLENTETFPPAGSTTVFVPQELVHPKYRSPKTSGLLLEVPKVKHWNVTLERPEVVDE